MRAILVVSLLASLFFVFTGCKGGGKGDAPAQLLSLINDYRKGQSVQPLVWDYGTEDPLPLSPPLADVAQAYAQWLDNQLPKHEFPYSENADGEGLTGRLTNAGYNVPPISVTASAEVGRSDPTLTNAQLFFNSLTTAEKATISRTDVDRIGIGHVSPPAHLPPYNHYWVVDLIKRDTGP
jgi:hypothetical protein